MVVGAACWACGVRHYKVVPRPQDSWVRWHCQDCNVGWSAPPAEQARQIVPV